MIAGEGLTGVLIAVLTIFGVHEIFDLSGMLNLSSTVSQILSLATFALMILIILKFTIWKKRKVEKK